MNTHYYSGATAIADYLRPSPEKYIPLVELPEDLNPFLKKYDIHIDAKLMNTLPLGNVKSLPAWRMLEQSKGIKDKRVIEASSGNTALSLGLLAPHFGASSVHAIASPDVSEGKLTLLKLAGVDVELIQGPICPDPNDPEGAITTARQQGSLSDAINLGQYDNDANPAAHEHLTGPQLYQQLGSSIGMLCAGLGTSGTLLGTARYLQTKIPNLHVTGIVRKPNNSVPGVRTINGLAEVSFPWSEHVTEPLVEVSQKESYAKSLLLIRHGLLVGPSAGFAFAGALKQLRRLEKSGDITSLSGKHVVFICPDSPYPYANEYEKILDASLFPIIKNNSLRVKDAVIPPTVPEIDVHTVRDMTDIEIIDVREPDEFNDHHIPTATNVPLTQLPKWIKARPQDDLRHILFVCRSGNRSARATHLSLQMELSASNMKGGMIEWSAHKYPRVRSPFCPPAQ